MGFFGIFGRKKEDRIIEIDSEIIKHTKEHQNCIRELKKVDSEIVKAKNEFGRERDLGKKAAALLRLKHLSEKRKALVQRIVVLTQKMGKGMKQDVQTLRKK